MKTRKLRPGDRVRCPTHLQPRENPGPMKVDSLLITVIRRRANPEGPLAVILTDWGCVYEVKASLILMRRAPPTKDEVDFFNAQGV